MSITEGKYFPSLIHGTMYRAEMYYFCLYRLARIERIEKLLKFEINFHRSGMKTQNFKMTIICSIILFYTMVFLFFFNAICISKLPGH